MIDQARPAALAAAVAMHAAAGDLVLQLGVDAAYTITTDYQRVLGTAEVFLAWLHGPRFLTLSAGPLIDQTTGALTGPPPPGVHVQIHDNEQFSLTVDATDAKGFDTDAGTVTWTSSDETVIPSTNVSADTHTFTAVAGAPGSCVVTASITLADGTVLSVTEAIDVVPGGVATITLVEGPVEVQP